MCVIMCTNYVNYIRGRTYIGNANTRVEKLRNIILGVRETNGWFETLSILLVGICANSWTGK